MKISILSLLLNWTPSELATVVPKRVRSASDVTLAPLKKEVLQLVRRSADIRHEADKIQSFAQRRYKKDDARHIWIAPILLVGDYVFLDRLRRFHLAAKTFASEVYNKLAPRE